MNKLFLAFTLLFALALGSTGRDYWRMTHLNRDARRIEGRVAECPSDSDVPHETVQATYEFEVGGKKYQGTFESTPGARGHEVTVYYSPSHPEFNSEESPERAMERSGSLLTGLTITYLFWAGVFVVIQRLRRK